MSECECPHCGHLMKDLWDFGLGDDESIETECGECLKPVRIRCVVSVDYFADELEAKP